MWRALGVAAFVLATIAAVLIGEDLRRSPARRPKLASGAEAALRPLTPQRAAWTRTALHLEGWTLVDNDPELLAYVRMARADSALRFRAWTRVEGLKAFRPIGRPDYRSALYLVQVDCPSQRFAPLQNAFYAGNDLQRLVEQATDPDGQAWRPLDPDFPPDGAFLKTCAALAASRR